MGFSRCDKHMPSNRPSQVWNMDVKLNWLIGCHYCHLCRYFSAIYFSAMCFKFCLIVTCSHAFGLLGLRALPQWLRLGYQETWKHGAKRAPTKITHKYTLFGSDYGWIQFKSNAILHPWLHGTALQGCGTHIGFEKSCSILRIWRTGYQFGGTREEYILGYPGKFEIGAKARKIQGVEATWSCKSGTVPCKLQSWD